jgi:hypothetical protein
MATVVQSTQADNGSTAVAITFTGVTAGNTLVAFPRNDNAHSDISVTDDKGNTWVEVNETDGTPGMLAAYALNASSGDTVITAHFGDAFSGLFLAEISGVSAVGGNNTSSGTDGFAASGGVTLSASGIVVAAMVVRSGGAISEGSWTLLQEQESYTNTCGSFIYKIASSGTEFPLWTNPAAAWRASGFALLDTAGGGASGTGVVRKLRRLVS